MAKYSVELPNEIIEELTGRSDNIVKIMGSMLEAGGKVTERDVRANIAGSFKTPGEILRGLKLTRVYSNADGGRSIKLGFYGYNKSHTSKKYPGGVPIALIAAAREYGTSSGESAKPFFRKAFKRAGIDAAMQQVHDKYIKE